MGCVKRDDDDQTEGQSWIFTGHCFPPGGLVAQARIACQRTPLAKTRFVRRQSENSAHDLL
jgi:hypothetical protein